MELLGDELIKLCSGAQNLVLVAPYMKIQTLSRVLSNLNPQATISCITKWTPHDVAVGASDIECRTIVTKFGGFFAIHPTLHAKYYRIDNVVLIGSANLTQSAMGWSQHPNLEILCRPIDSFDANAFQKALLKGMREVSDDEFARWEGIVKVRENRETTSSSFQLVLDHWHPRTREPQNLELAYRKREDRIASFDERTAAQSDLLTLMIPPELTEEEFRDWVSTCLFASPFANSVLQLQGEESSIIYSALAEAYDLHVSEARRKLETVYNWFNFFAPETLSSEN